MKRYIIFTLILIMPFLALAARSSAGLTPASRFYFLDILFEKIDLSLTFSPEKRAQKALDYADERLAEAEVVAEEKNTNAVKVAIAGYESSMILAAGESKQIKNKEKMGILITSITDNTSKHEEILAEIYNKVSDEVKKTIENAIETSAKNQKEAFEETQKLKKTVEELQKDIESLKQQGQSDQDKEVAELRREIEVLKSQPPKVTPPRIIERVVEVPPVAPQKDTQRLSNSEIIDKIKPAVVYIQTSDGSGSGMIIESDGYVLTNAHVVSSVDTARVKLSDDRLFVASVVGRDEDIDLSLLKMRGDNFPMVILGDSSVNILKQGDEVFAFGYPFGLEGDVSFKEGTISRRQTYEGITYLETSAQVHPGNSGGPLVDRLGQVIGINTQAVGKGVGGALVGESIKFALPINLARGLIPELKSGRNIILPKVALPTLPSVTTPTPIQPYTPPQDTTQTPTPSVITETPTFPSIPVIETKKELEVTVNKTSVPASGYDAVTFKAQYKEYGIGKVTKIEFITPDPKQNQTHDHDYGCSFGLNCSIALGYTIPAKPGTYTFTFKAEGIEKTMNIEATPFEEVKPQATFTKGLNTFPPSYTGQDGLAYFTVSGLDNEEITFSKVKYEIVSNEFTLKEVELSCCGGVSTTGIIAVGRPGQNPIRKGADHWINLFVRTKDATKLGTFQLVITSIVAIGEKSGATKELLRSPVTLDVTIQ